MNTNNFDKSSTGINFKLSCGYDCELARIEWNENFDIIQHSGYNQTGIYFFKEYGNFEKPDKLSDCYDLSKVTEKQARKFCFDYYNVSEKSELHLIKQIIEDKRNYSDLWYDFMVDEILDNENEIGLITACKDGFPEIEGASLQYGCMSTMGYSQGEYGLILYKLDEEGKIWENRSEYFNHLFWDAPIYCRLTVKGEEYILDEYLMDDWEWDRDLIIKNAPECAREWLEDNLPDTPDYD